MRYRRINYDDDIVKVYDPKEKLIYKGIEDFEPMKNEAWEWDEKDKAYYFCGYKKVCIG